MEFAELVLKRVSIRKWESRKVERERIINVVEAARRAPSWGNSQPWRFIVIEEKEGVRKLATASGDQPVVATAPVVIICAGDFEAFSKKNMIRSVKELIATGTLDLELTDEELEALFSEGSPTAVIGEEAQKFRTREQIIIAMAYMTMAAVDQGLGTCWIGGFDADMVLKDFELPGKTVIHALLAMGYPAESPGPRPRKPLEAIASFGKYPG
jgi:nitroreductase